MTLGLLWASVIPKAGRAFGYGGLHDFARFAGYAILAFAWRRGAPRGPAWVMLVAVIAFGFVQEAIEVPGHGHPYEPRALSRMNARAQG